MGSISDLIQPPSEDNLSSNIQSDNVPESTAGNDKSILSGILSEGANPSSPQVSVSDIYPSDLKLMSVLNNYYSNNVPSSDYPTQQEYYPQSNNINKGTYSGSTFSMPIYAPGISEVPLSAFDKRRRILNDAAVSAYNASQIKQPEVPKTYPMYQDILNKGFSDGFQKFTDIAKLHGAAGFKMLQDHSTRLGQEFQNFKDNYSFMAREGNTLAATALQIKKDSEDPNKYVSPETRAIVSNILSNADNINKNLFQNGNIEKQMGMLNSYVSVDKAINETVSKLKETIKSTVGNANVEAGSPEGISIAKVVTDKFLEPKNVKNITEELAREYNIPGVDADYLTKRIMSMFPNQKTIEIKPENSASLTEYNDKKGLYNIQAESLWSMFSKHALGKQEVFPMQGGAENEDNTKGTPVLSGISESLSGHKLGTFDYQNKKADGSYELLKDQPNVISAEKWQNGKLYIQDSRTKFSTTSLKDNDGSYKMAYPTGWRPIKNIWTELVAPYLRSNYTGGEDVKIETMMKKQAKDLGIDIYNLKKGDLEKLERVSEVTGGLPATKDNNSGSFDASKYFKKNLNR